jgi:hypothetical protein
MRIMSRITVALLLLVFAVAGLAVTARAQQEPTPEASSRPLLEPSPVACPPDRILVKVREGVDAPMLIARYGGTVVQTIIGIDVQVVEVPHGTGQQAIDALSADPDVVYAEADQIVTIQTDGPTGGCP